MQKLNVNVIALARKEKMKRLETELSCLGSISSGTQIVCPLCQYTSRNNKKGSAVVFRNDGWSAFKCFSCGKWRRI